MEGVKQDVNIEKTSDESNPKKPNDDKEEIKQTVNRDTDSIKSEEMRDESTVPPEVVRKVSITKTKQRRESIKETNDETEKDKIKKMILQSDSKAMMKAMRKPGRSVSQKGFGIQASDMKHFERKQSSNNFSSVMRGSNVKRLQSEDRSQKDDESLPYSRSSSQGSSVKLDSMLQISTVNKTKNDGDDAEKVLSKSLPSKKSPKSPEASKEEVHPLDKVRPKRIKVQPKRSISEGHGSRQNMTATGIGMGTTQSANMPLPTRKGSQACNIQ